MAKFPEATARMFQNVFICRKCKTKLRVNPQKVLRKEVKCRNCQGRVFRAAKKTKAAAAKAK